MTIAAHHVLFDSENHDQAKMLAEFWSAALGTQISVANGTVQVSMPTVGQLHAVCSDGFSTEVPVSGRVHIVFTSLESKLSDEVNRLFALGATLVDDRRREGFHGAGWVILADPAGNEFRVASNANEVAAVEEQTSKA